MIMFVIIINMNKQITGLLTEARAFYPEYLVAHSDRTNRVLHFMGASLVCAGFAAALVTLTWWWVPLAIFTGYLLPGIGHHFFQHNESFRATKPVLCVICAAWLYGDTLLLRIGKKMAAAQAKKNVTV